MSNTFPNFLLKSDITVPLRHGALNFSANVFPIEVEEQKRPPLTCGLLEFHSLHVLAFIVDLVGFCLPLSFSPGSCTRAEGFLVPLAINEDGP
jgi:hypothetical protein